jgi:hypothetical protein
MVQHQGGSTSQLIDVVTFGVQLGLDATCHSEGREGGASGGGLRGGLRLPFIITVTMYRP